MKLPYSATESGFPCRRGDGCQVTIHPDYSTVPADVILETGRKVRRRVRDIAKIAALKQASRDREKHEHDVHGPLVIRPMVFRGAQGT